MDHFIYYCSVKHFNYRTNTGFMIPKNLYIRLFSFLIFLLCSFQLYSQISQIARINKRTETITVLDSINGYKSETVLEFKTEPDRNRIEIDYNGLYHIDILELFSYNKKKLVRDNRYILTDLDMESEFFYLDSKYKMIECEPNKRYVCKYEQHSEELMYLSNVLLNQAFQVDTFEYFIRVPENYQLKFVEFNTNFLNSLMIDTLYKNKLTIFHIKAVPAEPLNPFTVFKQNYSMIRKPMLRIIVTPVNYQGRESEYFSKWYRQLLKPVGVLSSESKRKADSLLYGINDTDSIIEKIYSYVQKSVRYVGMYKGIGAFQPHNVNEVFSNQKGDCKDVANLLCQLLNYKGIEAWPALTNIGNTDMSFDFPSLSSANHLVCAVKRNDSWLILDATDDFHQIGDPLLALQGRKLFIVTGNSFALYDYPISESGNNQSVTSVFLELKETTISGTFETVYYGLSGYFFKFLKNYYSQRDFNFFLKEYMNSNSEEIKFTGLEVLEENKTVILKGNVEVDGSVINRIEDKTYVLLSFLPFPIPKLINRKEVQNDLFLENTINAVLDIKIDLKQPIHNILFNPLDFERENTKFQMSASGKGSNILRINYVFSINDINVNQKNIDDINQMLSKYNEQKAIIVQ